jgi:hypothetical protein
VADKKSKPEKSSPDWEAIEREYRPGILSVREIARQFNVSNTAIHKQAKKEDWERDLTAKVRAAVAKKLLKAESKKETDREIVDAAAERGASVIKLHRTDVARSLSLVNLLSSQLQEAAENRDDIEYEILKDTIGEDGKVDFKRRSLMKRAISLPAHAGVIRDLSAAQKNLITLERQAYGLNGHNPEEEDERIVTIHIHGVKTTRAEVT